MQDALIKRYSELHRPIILDGAMGSLLQMRGIPVDGPLWSAKVNINNPDEVFKVHQEYIEAGADIITTNTFRTNPHALKLAGLEKDSSKIVNSAVTLAHEAISDRNIILAGSNAPAEDCYQVKRTISHSALSENHSKHIELLLDSSVDIIWNETFSHYDEIILVCEYCSTYNIPYVINLFIDSGLHLLSGEHIYEVFGSIQKYNPVAIGINCISPDIFGKFYSHFKSSTHWGFYLNCGSGLYTDAEIETGITPVEYTDNAKYYLDKHPLFVGSCCGSSPEHTKMLKELILEIYSN